MVLLALGILFLAGNPFINPQGHSKSYINIEDTCLPGHGLPVGSIKMVQGKSILIRPKIEHSCWAEEGAPLFISDVISTLDTGRVRFTFNDGSQVTLSYRTELEITQCVYDKARKERSLFFNVRSGKARFVIKRLDEFKEKTAKIMTKTALVVVKGSDFLIEANDESTKITCFKDTHLEVINLSFLDMEPVSIMEFRSTIFKKDDLTSQVEEISQEEAERIIQDFSFPEPEAKMDIQKEIIKDIQKEESGQAGETDKKEGIEAKDIIKEGPAQVQEFQEEGIKQEDKDSYIKEEEAVEADEVDKLDKAIFVSEDELVEPEALEKPEEPETPEVIIQEEDPIIIPSEVSDEKNEEPIVLPEFPGPPF